MFHIIKPTKFLNFVCTPVSRVSTNLKLSNEPVDVQTPKLLITGRPWSASISTTAVTSSFDPCNPKGSSSSNNPCRPRGGGSSQSSGGSYNPCRPGGRGGGDSLKSLKDKVCVITGGAEGIGYVMAEAYLQKKAKVAILLDINEQMGMEAQKTLNCKYGDDKAVFCKCDVVTDLEEMSKNIFAAYKHVDVLVNNAGILDQIPAKKLIDINVAALIEWTLKYWNHMRKDKGGKGGTIVNLASIYGYRIDPFHPIYQSSKFAVMGFTKALGHAYTFKKTGVRIMAICPGFTHSKMTSKARPWDDMYGEDLNKFLKAQAWQNLDAVAMCAIKSFENGDSGTAWVIEGNKMAEVILKNMAC